MNAEVKEQIHQVVDEIKKTMGQLIGSRVYIGLYDNKGQSILEEEALGGFKEFIASFIKTNFNLLENNDHSLPLSGHGIIFFKLNAKLMIVLYIIKGKVGQLLAFKPKMKYFGEKIAPLLESSSEAPETQSEAVLEEAVVPLGLQTIRRKLFINPKMTKKITGKEKFDISEAKLFQFYTGDHMLDEIKQELTNIEVDSLIYKHVTNKMISIGEYNVYEVSCPECKAKHHYYLPIYAREFAKNNDVKIQISNEKVCLHTFLVFMDKKSKIKTKILEKLSTIENELNMDDINLNTIAKFFGQDILFNMFHAFLFKKQLVLITNIDPKKLNIIYYFWRTIFPTIQKDGDDQDILIIPANVYFRNQKLFKDSLLIDFDTNAILREPYEPELDFEITLYKKLVRIEEKKQILFLNQEIERILGLTDVVIEEIARFKEITEERLIEKLKERNIDLQVKEIPIIQILAEIYYDDKTLFKKIKKTVVGKMSEFLSAI